jgi:hypothetical protein
VTIPKLWSSPAGVWEDVRCVVLILDVARAFSEGQAARPSIKPPLMRYHLLPSTRECISRNDIIDLGFEVHDSGGYRNQINIVEGSIEICGEWGTFVDEGVRLPVEHPTELVYENVVAEELCN